MMTPPEELKLTWDPSRDGNVPYYFREKAPGERCGWTIHWIIPGPDKTLNGKNLGPTAKVITPKEWHGELTVDQVLAELQDAAVSAPLPFCQDAARLYFGITYDDPDAWRNKAEALIVKLRETYRTAIAPFNRPDKSTIMQTNQLRRSWE